MVAQHRVQHSVRHRMALGGQAGGERSDGGAMKVMMVRAAALGGPGGYPHAKSRSLKLRLGFSGSQAGGLLMRSPNLLTAKVLPKSSSSSSVSGLRGGSSKGTRTCWAQTASSKDPNSNPS